MKTIPRKQSRARVQLDKAVDEEEIVSQEVPVLAEGLRVVGQEEDNVGVAGHARVGITAAGEPLLIRSPIH